MFLFTFLRSAPTNAFPSTPTPGDSNRPRAKITSTCGQAADAEGIAAPPGRIDGPTSRPVATRTAVTAAMRLRRARSMLLRSTRKITSPMLADELTQSFRRSLLQTACGEVGRLSDEAARVVRGPVRVEVF